MTRSSRPALGGAIFISVMLFAGAYFTFAAVQGDHGLFRRIQIEAQEEELIRERDRLVAELAEIRNKTTRLSNEFLDLDLLDERARMVLGRIRPDEIVFR
ncbi:MAG: septum formation initiator family protein [Rhodobacteraceae bacterium]|nr:septum formation initiator family protein [Paracoccaceae bacterium]